jgi:hypothetical protein
MLVDGLAHNLTFPDSITDYLISIDTLVLLPTAYRFHDPFFFSFLPIAMPQSFTPKFMLST